MFVRYRMNKIINLLLNDQSDVVINLITSDKYRKALYALQAVGSITITEGWSGNILNISLLDAYAVYQLSRHDVWMNRLWGFLSGVAITLAAEFLVNVAGL